MSRCPTVPFAGCETMDGQANVKRLPCVGINLRYALPPAERGAESNNQANGTGNDGGGIPFTGNGARLSPGRALLCGLALLLCGGEALARQLPSDMLVGFVASAQYPVITLKKPKQSLLRSVLTLGLGKKTVSYSVAPSVRIRTAQNLFIVYGRMPQLKGSFVGLKSDNNGQVKQIWELTEKEALDYVRRPDARFPQ